MGPDAKQEGVLLCCGLECEIMLNQESVKGRMEFRLYGVRVLYSVPQVLNYLQVTSLLLSIVYSGTASHCLRVEEYED